MLVTDVTTRLAARRPGPWDEVQAAYRTELDRLHEGLRASVEGTPLCPVAMQLIAAGGKRVRPLLSWISCAAVGGDTERVAGVALASELSHAATLLHDDVLDDSAERRGVPAARILYGNQLSVLAGDFLLSRALEVVARTHSQPLLLAYCHCLEELICGEVMQHENCFRADVTEAVYRRIIELKTASLFAWTAQGAARLAGADEELSAAFERFGRGLGLAFQMVDDWLDWLGDPALTGKAVRADLKEGKPSLAVIYGAQVSAAVREWVQEHVSADAPPPEDETIAGLADELRGCGALTRVQKACKEEVAHAIAALSAVPDAEGRGRLERFAHLLLARLH